MTSDPYGVLAYVAASPIITIWDPIDEEGPEEPLTDRDFAGRDYSEEARAHRIRAFEQESYRARSDGTYGHAFTEEEMERARAIARWGGVDVDPVAEILGEPVQVPRPARTGYLPPSKPDPVTELFHDVDVELWEEEHPESVGRNTWATMIEGARVRLITVSAVHCHFEVTEPNHDPVNVSQWRPTGMFDVMEVATEAYRHVRAMHAADATPSPVPSPVSSPAGNRATRRGTRADVMAQWTRERYRTWSRRH